jgi:hypothetical protein
MDPQSVTAASLRRRQLDVGCADAAGPSTASTSMRDVCRRDRLLRKLGAVHRHGHLERLDVRCRQRERRPIEDVGPPLVAAHDLPLAVQGQPARPGRGRLGHGKSGGGALTKPAYSDKPPLPFLIPNPPCSFKVAPAQGAGREDFTEPPPTPRDFPFPGDPSPLRPQIASHVAPTVHTGPWHTEGNAQG